MSGGDNNPPNESSNGSDGSRQSFNFINMLSGFARMVSEPLDIRSLQNLIFQQTGTWLEPAHHNSAQDATPSRFSTVPNANNEQAQTQFPPHPAPSLDEPNINVPPAGNISYSTPIKHAHTSVFQMALVELFQADIKALAELTVTIDNMFVNAEDKDTTTTKDIIDEITLQFGSGSYKQRFVMSIKKKVKKRLTLLVREEVDPISDIADFHIDIEAFWLFCEVHFERTVERVSSNHALVPADDKRNFKK